MKKVCSKPAVIFALLLIGTYNGPGFLETIYCKFGEDTGKME